MIIDVLRYWPFGGRRFSPEIEQIIRRRRLAAWIAVAAMVAIAVPMGAGPGYFYAAVLALWAAAAAFAGAQTIRLRHRGVATLWFLDIWFRPIRPQLIPQDRPWEKFNGPLSQPRLWLLIVLLIGFAISLSDQVNAVAYLTGQVPTATFVPQSHFRQCQKKEPAGCTTYTMGIRLDTGDQVVYPGALTIGQPVQVRLPLSWLPPLDPNLPSASNAEGDTFFGMLIDVSIATILSGYVVRWLGRRSPGLPWRPRPVPEEDLEPVPGDARTANGSTRNTARKKLKKQHRKR
jgi:hypothetical protein